MKKLLLVLLLSPSILFAQQESDIYRADSLKSLADSLLVISHHQEAADLFDQVQEIYKEQAVWDKFFYARNGKTEALWRLGEYEQSFATARDIIDGAREKIGVNSLPEGRALMNIGSAFQQIYQPDSTIFYYKRALTIFDMHGENRPPVFTISCSVNMGVAYIQKGDYDSAIEYINKALAGGEKHYEENDPKLAIMLLNIGAAYTSKLYYDKAMSSYLRAAEMYEAKGIRNLASAYVTHNIGILYRVKGQYDLANQYYLESFNQTLGILGPNHPSISESYMSLGGLRKIQGNFDEAFEYLNKALELNGLHLGNNGRSASNINHQLGNIYRDTQDYDKALEYFLVALDIEERIGEENNTWMGFIQMELGITYTLTGDYNNALDYLKSSISLLTQINGEKDPAVAFGYRNLAFLYQTQGDLDLALDNYQKSIYANMEMADYESMLDYPTPIDYLNLNYFLQSMSEKADLLVEIYRANGQRQYLLTALEMFSVCDELLETTRLTISNSSDKIEIQQLFAQIYPDAFQASMLALEDFGDDKYLNKCFHFMERSRARVLYDAITQTGSINWGGIPDSIIVRQNELKADVSSFRSKIKEVKNSTTVADSLEVLRLQGLLFEVQREQDELLKIIESRFPRYNDLKYNNRTNSISDVQKELKSNQAFIEYFVADSLLYAAAITKGSVSIHKINEIDSMNHEISLFRDHLTQQSSLGITQNSFNKFTGLSSRIYSKYVEKVLTNLPADIDKLIIVPEASLYYVPFELLLLESFTTDIVDFRAPSYLIKKYGVSYAYSAGLQFEQFQERTNRVGKLASFAPAYSGKSEDSVTLVRSGKFRESIVPLEWNSREAQAITEPSGGQAYLGKEATERAFKANTGNARILHLAMHAFVDDDDPMNSKLIFTQDNDSIEDGFLHTFELYNMELNAELAVLSACETGYGKLVEGEGIISLARGFSHAGVPSVVMSHWQVDDLATSELMEIFYENLADGLAKDQALRKAKLAFLETTDPLRTAPFYWGSFVLIGDPAEIDINKEYSTLYLLLVGVGVTVLFIVFYIRRKKARS